MKNENILIDKNENEKLIRLKLFWQSEVGNYILIKFDWNIYLYENNKCL